MVFNPESDDEVIRDAVSHKLYIFLVKPRKNVLRESNQAKAPTSPFHTGDSLIYKKEGHIEMVELVDVNTNEPDSIKYIIKFLIVITMVVTKEFLESGNVSNIGSITIYSENYINESNNITRENLR